MKILTIFSSLSRINHRQDEAQSCVSWENSLNETYEKRILHQKCSTLKASSSINSMYSCPDSIQVHGNWGWTRFETCNPHNAHFVECGDPRDEPVVVWG